MKEEPPKISLWSGTRLTKIQAETNGIAERLVRRVKEGTCAVLLQSGLGEKWLAVSLERYCYLRNVQDFLADGRRTIERTSDSVWLHGGISSYFCERPVEAPSTWSEKSFLKYSSDMHGSLGEFGKETFG